MPHPLLTLGVPLGLASTLAHAGYITHVETLSGASFIEVAPGATVTIRVRAEATAPGQTADSAILRLIFSQPGLELVPGWFDWAAPFVTGGVDDLSEPAPDLTGPIDATTYADPFDPEAVDLYFENLTPSPADKFAQGTLLTIALRVPDSTPGGSIFQIAPAPDTFTSGSSIVPVQGGNGLVIQTLIPTPASALVPMTAAAMGWTKRRRRGKS